jgi:hypothetical protein
LCQSTGGNGDHERDQIHSLISCHIPPKVLEGPECVAGTLRPNDLRVSKST